MTTVSVGVDSAGQICGSQSKKQDRMSPQEQLHYAMGQLAYAMAGIDGNVQNEERRKFHDIIMAEVKEHHYSFNVSDIIFQVLDKDKTDAQTAYDWAMNQFRLNSHYLSPELKWVFIRIAEAVAKAYPPVTMEERQLMDRFRKEILLLQGDPVYYS